MELIKMKYYTIYDADTDELITHGTARECAKKWT